MDASLTERPFSPKGTPTYELAEDRKEEDRNDEQQQKESDYHRLKQVEQPNADNQARWVKKSGKSVYGYKKHCH